MTPRILADNVLNWWSLKTRAEKRLFSGLALVFVLAASWSLVWSPIQRMRSSAVESLEQIAAARATLSAIPAGRIRDQLDPSDPERVRTKVTNSTAVSGILIQQIEADAGEVRLTLEPLAFDTLVIWLQNLSASEDIQVAEVRIERRPEPGFVSAELVLVAP